MNTKFIILLVFLVTVCSCSKRRDKDQGFQSDSTNLSEVVGDYNSNYISDTIVGKFNGIDVDTLVSLPIDTIPNKFDPDDIYAPWHYRWLVKSLRGTVKYLIIERTTRVAFVKEGDLDGDGGEEFGYVTQWPTSNWMGYHLFTYKNGDWKTLIEPTTIWLPHIDPENDLYNPKRYSGGDIARATGEKGKIHIRFSDVRNDGEDFLFIDTILKVNPQPVKWDE